MNRLDFAHMDPLSEPTNARAPESVRLLLERAVLQAIQYLDPSPNSTMGNPFVWWAQAAWNDITDPQPDSPLPPLATQLRVSGTPLAKAVVSQALRWEVFERDDFTCQHCGSRRLLQADHIVAESKGGETTMANLQTLCQPCNARKGTS